MKRKPEHTHVLRLGDQTVILYVDDRRPDDLPMAEIECDAALRPNDETVGEGEVLGFQASPMHLIAVAETSVINAR